MSSSFQNKLKKKKNESGDSKKALLSTGGDQPREVNLKDIELEFILSACVMIHQNES